MCANSLRKDHSLLFAEPFVYLRCSAAARSHQQQAVFRRSRNTSAGETWDQPAAELSHGCRNGVTQRFVTDPRRCAQTPETRCKDAKISWFTEVKSCRFPWQDDDSTCARGCIPMTEELHNLKTAKTIHLFNAKQQLVETLGKLSHKSFLFRINRNVLKIRG